MSDTPRTDAETRDGKYYDCGDTITLQSWEYLKDPYGEVVFADFARVLETELAEARRLAEKGRLGQVPSNRIFPWEVPNL